MINDLSFVIYAFCFDSFRDHNDWIIISFETLNQLEISTKRAIINTSN